MVNKRRGNERRGNKRRGNERRGNERRGNERCGNDRGGNDRRLRGVSVLVVAKFFGWSTVGGPTAIVVRRERPVWTRLHTLSTRKCVKRRKRG